jgi:hypothetical protein
VNRLAKLLALSLVLASSGLVPVVALAAEAACEVGGALEDDCCGETCAACACCPHRVSSEAMVAPLACGAAPLPGVVAAAVADLPDGSRPGVFHPPAR